jgi:phosphoribosylamine--glycine ligase
VVGPEAPLAAGVVDAFRAAGLPIFGPTRLAAQLESSKDFAKQFLQRHKIPTAKYQTFSDPAAAHAYVDAEGAPIVIKADGLAAGKGVVVAMSLDEAHAAIDAMLTHNTLGVQYDERGPRVVIEEFMDGEEASFIVMADGRHALPLATSQDHKRLVTPTRAPTPAAWAPTRPPRWSRPKCTPARCARSSCRPSSAWPPKACPTPASCTPA